MLIAFFYGFGGHCDVPKTRICSTDKRFPILLYIFPYFAHLPGEYVSSWVAS